VVCVPGSNSREGRVDRRIENGGRRRERRRRGERKGVKREK